MSTPTPTVVTLGGKTYNRSDTLARAIKTILFSHNLNSKLKEDEENLVLDLLRQGHAKADEKIGVGVKHIKVGAHPDYSDSRCFHVVRTDDTTADFSYRKCVETLFGVEKKQKKGALDYTPGLLLQFEVEDSRDEATKKRKRDDAEGGVKKEEAEEEDTVEELNADGESAAKKQKTKGGAVDRPIAPAMKIKQYFRQLTGDVGYVELKETHCSVRFKDEAAVAKAEEATKEGLELPDLKGLKLLKPVLVTGQAEEEYYRKIQAERKENNRRAEQENRAKPRNFRGRGRGGRGGRGRGGRGGRGGRDRPSKQE